jgi:phospholipid/cholesterol/gamma-HCH transport system substrate-binding protein
MNQTTKHIISWSELKLAVFVSIIILLVIVTISFSSLVQTVFAARTPLSISIEDVGGLRPGAPVWLQGIEIGAVQEVSFASNHETINITIKREYQHFLYGNTSAQIKSVGLLGSKYVELIRGTESSGPLKPHQTISGTLVDPLQNIDTSLTTAINRLSVLVNNVNKGQGFANTLVKDSTFASDVKGSTATFRSILEEFKKNPKKYINIKIF